MSVWLLRPSAQRCKRPLVPPGFAWPASQSRLIVLCPTGFGPLLRPRTISVRLPFPCVRRPVLWPDAPQFEDPIGLFSYAGLEKSHTTLYY